MIAQDLKQVLGLHPSHGQVTEKSVFPCGTLTMTSSHSQRGYRKGKKSLRRWELGDIAKKWKSGSLLRKTSHS